jgi:hypothetical protein
MPNNLPKTNYIIICGALLIYNIAGAIIYFNIILAGAGLLHQQHYPGAGNMVLPFLHPSPKCWIQIVVACAIQS